MYKLRNKRNHGITLIALVITIIVLLILAGISIQMLTGENAILSQAGRTRDLTGQKDIEERIQIAYLGAITNGKGSFDRGKFVEELDKTFGAGKYTLSTDGSMITIDGKDYDTGIPRKWSNAEKTAMTSNNITEVTGDDITNNNLKDTTKIKAVIKDEDNAQIPIPIDAEYVEGKESTGVVIKYKKSEFVWVPVPNAIYDSTKDSQLPKSSETGTLTNTNHEYTPMAINIGTEASPVYKGLLYDSDTTMSGAYLKYASASPYQGTTSQYREPALLEINDVETEGYTYYNTIGITEISLQQSYNLMIQSVTKYGGFFVGRYETSINEITNKAQSVSDVRPANAGDYVTFRWYNLYQKQKEFTESADKMQSYMIWGSQYDAMLNWALTGDDKVHVTALNNATHDRAYNAKTIRTRTTTETTDSITAIDKINNIYDLESNLSELTQEAYRQ